MLLSLEGSPLTAGFLAKFYVVAAGVSGAAWVLVFVLVTTSVIGLFYYLRVLVTMYARTTEVFPASTLFHPAGAVLIALTVLLVWFGVYPEVLLNLVRTVSPT
jgi:NADH-quinone oxidoreductase subunit N